MNCFFDLRHVNVLNLEASDLLFLNAVTQAPASRVLEINSPLSPLPNSVPCKKVATQQIISLNKSIH